MRMVREAILLDYYERGQLQRKSRPSNRKAARAFADTVVTPRVLFARANGVADGSVPLGVALGFVVWPELIPVFARDAVEVVYDFAVAHGQLADQLLMAAQPRAIDIDKAEIAVFKAQDGDVGARAH